MKKYLVIILLFLLAFTLCGNAIAQETDYPNVPGAETPGSGTTLPGFIVYIFNFALFLGTVIAGGSVLFAGVLYLTAGANRSRIEKAKERMKYAFFGLLLLLSSYLILNTINPNLTVFETPDLPKSTSSYSTVTSTPSTPPTEEFQEIPIGTLLEKMVAKNIDCYEEGDTYGTLLDCQDNKEVQVGHVNDYPEREGYCYDFDSDGNFIDASSSADGINPMTEHDRLDCIRKLKVPINKRLEKLKGWSEDLQQEVNKCSCKAPSPCRKEGICKTAGCGNPSCITNNLECKGVPYDANGDPCANRDYMDEEIRKRLRRNYEDDDLKELSVEEFRKRAVDHPKNHSGSEDPLLVADQVRFLMVNFLKPLEKGLKKDLANLRKSENTLKKCPYQLTLNYSKFIEWKEDSATNTIERVKFCEESASDSLNPNGKIVQSCAEADKTEINQYCQEFNCKSCYEKGNPNNKLKCGKCDLEVLKKGEVVPYKVGTAGTFSTSYKCDQYKLNNEKGEDFKLKEGCDTEDNKCKLCKIENEKSGDTKEKECVSHDDDPATFYCPKVGTEIIGPGELITSECTVVPSVKEGYPLGQIRIGEAVDRGERFGKLIYEEVEEINNRIEDATNALFDPEDPGKLKDPGPGPDDVLYSLPLGCVCDPSGWNFSITGDCLASCPCSPYPCSADPPLTQCNCTHLCNGNPHPCPMTAINNKVSTVQTSREKTKKSFERLIELLTDNESELKKDDPHRTEIINKLYDARPKMERCVTGFGHTDASDQVLRRFMSCYKALDLIKLNQINLKPWFPVPKSNKSCYPYNYNQVYSNGGFKGNFKFTSDQVDSCRNNIEGKECEEAIEDIGENGGMYNFFCCEK